MLVQLYSTSETTGVSALLDTHFIVQCDYNLKIIVLSFTRSIHPTEENKRRHKKRDRK